VVFVHAQVGLLGGVGSSFLHDITPNVITSIVISFFIVHPVVKNTARIYKKMNTKQEME
jgi:hypothetical protein